MALRVPSMLLIATFLAFSLFTLQAVATEPSASLKIIVYGATGRVGSRVVNEALDRGHQVTAVSRDPAKITLQHANLSAVKGDLLDANSVAALVTGQDAVVVAVRGSVGGSEEPEKTVHRMAVEVVVTVLRDMGDNAPRLIFVGGAGSLEIEPGVTYWESLGSFSKTFIPNFILQEIQGHLLVLEYLRLVDDVRWTYLSPPKTFKPGERTGTYSIGGDTMLKDSRGKSKISMEDYAVALVDEAENGDFIGKRFSVAYQNTGESVPSAKTTSEK
jgi:putative NADH-flavin reductase